MKRPCIALESEWKVESGRMNIEVEVGVVGDSQPLHRRNQRPVATSLIAQIFNLKGRCNLDEKEKVCCVFRQGDEAGFIVYAKDTPDEKIRIYDSGEVDARFDGPYCLDAASVFKQLASECDPHCVVPVSLAKKLFNPGIPFAA